MPGPRQTSSFTRLKSGEGPTSRQKSEPKVPAVPDGTVANGPRRCKGAAPEALSGGSKGLSRLVDPLERLIEGDVIPRLMMLHRIKAAAAAVEERAAVQQTSRLRKSRSSARSERVALLERAGLMNPGAIGDRGPSPRRGRRASRITQAHLDELVESILHDVLADSVHYCLALHERGYPLEQIFADLIAPAARLLGQKWIDDELDFLDVTVAAGRLQRVVMCLRQSHGAAGLLREAMLLTCAPGEQHTLGLQLAAEYLTEAGLEVVPFIAADFGEIENVLRSRSFSYVGISIGSQSLIGAALSAIECSRAAAKSSSLKVIVGGAAILENACLTSSATGADCVARDLGQALAFVEQCREDRSVLNSCG